VSNILLQPCHRGIAHEVGQRRIGGVDQLLLFGLREREGRDHYRNDGDRHCEPVGTENWVHEFPDSRGYLKVDFILLRLGSPQGVGANITFGNKSNSNPQ